jgi:hypothetical protein
MLATPLFSATRCACGFERLDDEEGSDHLLAAFVPEDNLGPDGQVHEEGELRACSCGFSASSGPELDAHFLAVFMTADRLDRDGLRHSPIN